MQTNRLARRRPYLVANISPEAFATREEKSHRMARQPATHRDAHQALLREQVVLLDIVSQVERDHQIEEREPLRRVVGALEVDQRCGEQVRVGQHAVTIARQELLHERSVWTAQEASEKVRHGGGHLQVASSTYGSKVAAL